ncbi:asparaginase [Gordonia soli]|uniref:asparaginase n=1 Tax=Gordonia soli NBRC 108243 TaxID=1223545 RepID=M0QN67_9ACTN|nr:asparaginase [Gordonia soli]GAC70018.1 putative L-asparaginase [Gordonia soli NBRC 108243]
MTSTNIVVISTGGTIAATATDDGAVPSVGSAQLVSAATRDSTQDRHVLRTVDLFAVDSSALTPVDQLRIARAVADALSDPTVAGVVVTHGTDTMEESAVLVDVLHTDVRPVVFTGAQRPADAAEPDGPANLADAVRVAADPASRGRGVLVTMGGRVLPARGLFKSSTTALEAFETIHPTLGRPTLPFPPASASLPRVDLVALYPGIAPGVIAAALAQNTAGVVVSATGSGNTHPDIAAEISRAIRGGTPVIVTSRVPHGAVVPTYGGGGGAVDLVRAGAIVSEWLRAPQARIVLMLLVAAGGATADIADFFARTAPGD